MQKLFLSSFMVITVLFSNTSSVSAWDDVGHKITGYIAWQRMSPTARERVIKILRSAPEDSHLSVYFQSYGARTQADKQLDYFMLVPTWGDIVRDRAFPVRYEKYHKGDWHYTSVFWRQASGKAELIADRKPDGQAIEKLPELEKAMRDPAVSDKDKAIALAWFLHIGGDIHQPLHSSSRVTDVEAEGDRGGNTFLISPEGAARADQQNLHWFWDSIVPRNLPYDFGLCEGDYVRHIANSMISRYPFEAEKSGLALSSYPTWKDESLKLAQTEVFRSDLKRFETPSDDYRRNAFAVSERRLTMAGYRMGEILNAIFGTPAEAATSAQASCPVIRKIMYPIFKLQTPENIAKTKPTIAVLNTCPTGPAARPTILIETMGVKTHRTFDVVKVFGSEAEARDYAAKNSITNISFTAQ